MLVAHAVAGVAAPHRFDGAADLIGTIERGDDDGERLGELPGLLAAWAAKERLEGRVRLGEASVEHRGRLLENRLHDLETAVYECDLLGGHVCFLSMRGVNPRYGHGRKTVTESITLGLAGQAGQAGRRVRWVGRVGQAWPARP